MTQNRKADKGNLLRIALRHPIHHELILLSPCKTLSWSQPQSPSFGVLFLIFQGGPLLSFHSSLASLGFLPSEMLPRALSITWDALGCPLFAISHQGSNPSTWPKSTREQAATVYWNDRKLSWRPAYWLVNSIKLESGTLSIKNTLYLAWPYSQKPTNWEQRQLWEVSMQSRHWTAIILPALHSFFSLYALDIKINTLQCIQKNSATMFSFIFFTQEKTSPHGPQIFVIPYYYL